MKQEGILSYLNLQRLKAPIESLARPVTCNIHFERSSLLKHWKNLSTLHLSRENLCKKQYCNVTKTNRFVLKILQKLNHFVLKVRTGGFADSITAVLYCLSETIFFSFNT